MSKSLNVATATSPMASLFASEFPGLDVIGKSGEVKSDLDLLILTGGEDVDPERYGQRPRGARGWNTSRDEIEMRVFREAARRGTKVLGVCRGMQLMNVCMGGNLVQDIVEDHGGHHPLNHLIESPLGWLTYVNSLHHQGLKIIGSDYARYSVIALHEDGIPEIVVWGNTFLGVQFHPEMFAPAMKKKFFDLIKQWVTGEVSLELPPTRDFEPYAVMTEEELARARMNNERQPFRITPRDGVNGRTVAATLDQIREIGRDVAERARVQRDGEGNLEPIRVARWDPVFVDDTETLNLQVNDRANELQEIEPDEDGDDE